MSVNHFELDLIKYVLVLKKLFEKEKKVEYDSYYLWHFSFFFFSYNEDVTTFLFIYTYRFL